MAKSFAAKKETDKQAKWYEVFRNLKSGDWGIEYNAKTGRIQLKDPNSQIQYSAMTAHACQMIAAERHGITYLSWFKK